MLKLIQNTQPMYRDMLPKHIRPFTCVQGFSVSKEVSQ